MTEETEAKPDTLFSLLTDLENADSGLVEFNPEEHREKLLGAELKIDAYKYVLNKYESRIEEIAKEIAELTAVKRSLESKSTAMKSMVLWIFKQKQLEKFPGVKYVAQVISKKKIVIKTQPDARLYLDFPTLIRREYSWEKREFDKLFATVPQLKELATEETTDYIKFNLKKGIE